MLADFPVFFRPALFRFLMIFSASSVLFLCALCVEIFSFPASTNPVSYANRLPFSRRLINRSQNNHVPMPLPPIRLDGLLRLNRTCKRIQLRRKLIRHPEFLLKPLPANLPRQSPLFIKRERRRQTSPSFRPLHKHKRRNRRAVSRSPLHNQPARKMHPERNPLLHVLKSLRVFFPRVRAHLHRILFHHPPARVHAINAQ